MQVLLIMCLLSAYPTSWVINIHAHTACIQDSSLGT
ncbi:Protein of unknown function [Pyronema omphalodes CBS 100304]|uniref:Uncharacterized protein n=1 Tax=Pyronema omphalodes (strain CBS 100304) TaxID=1076935 RepID=U4LB47_PYROM|nr:Protein of unknown function [Pyronema omphalodes CBS 100304]